MELARRGAVLLPLFAVLLAGCACAADFEVPSLAASRRAVGDLSELDPVRRRAFGNFTGFARIPAPGPHDWLAQHEEAGQTFARYLAVRPNRVDGERRVIYLQPLGSFTADQRAVLELLREFTGLYFTLECRLQEDLDPSASGITERRNPHGGQRQLLAGDLLELLREDLPADAYCRLGITMTDLYPEDDWNFVFGMASLRARTGIYSLARYDDAFYGRAGAGAAAATAPATFLLRSCKVLAHETGHMFCMDHEIYFHGVMNGSNHLDESDAQPLHLSPLSLRKLQYLIGFDVAGRYAALERFYREHDLTTQADWVQARLAVVTGEGGADPD